VDGFDGLGVVGVGVTELVRRKASADAGRRRYVAKLGARAAASRASDMVLHWDEVLA
jgi:hypothetical protein